MSQEPALLSSPLQGFTDFRFRSAFRQYFGGIDQYLAPYIRLNGKGEIKAAQKRDILPANNHALDLVPQVMSKDAGEFLSVADYVQMLGYNELNWNLGCPYPMVAKRGMGSGMLGSPEIIDQVLQTVFQESGIRVSVKMRLGYEDREEIFRVLPVLEKYPLEHICIHPRIGRQLYKGQVDLESFEQCLGLSSHRILYNGDIRSVRDFRTMSDRFPEISGWMIGRGMIADPFLPSMIKSDTLSYPEDALETFGKFHDSLFSSYTEALSGAKHILMKMHQFWEYFILLFPGSPKGLKKIKKAQSIHAYQEQVRLILRSGIRQEA